MTFDEVLAQVQDLLQREQRVSYRGLKRRFALDDEYLEDLKEELIGAKRLAADEDGRFLVWTGNSSLESRVQSLESEGQGRDSTVQTLDPRRQTLDAAAERRQLTVMFCDLVGSTELSTQLDPEELREVILAYRECCAMVIRRFEGYLAKYIGDGLLVYFGYPVAHEDDAHRAVRVGLGIVGALQELSVPRVQLPRLLQVRIGIHTGLVVAGEMGVGDQPEPLAIVGETPNVAARIQGLAEANTVIVSAATQRLIDGQFECHPFGSHLLKGIATPVAVYHVQGERQNLSPLASKTTLTPLVGREQEVEVLLDCWEQVKEGRGQVVVLSGEPGIGKSRLAYTLREHVTAEGSLLFEARGSPYYQHSAFYPVIEGIQRTWLLTRQDTDTEKVAKLERALALYDLQAALPLFAALLSLPTPPQYPPLTLSPQKRKERTLQVLLQLLATQAERQATVVVWEDLHWVDPSSLEFVTLLVEQIPTTKLLLVLTFRPDFTPSWQVRSHITQLPLQRLGQQQVEAMIEQVRAGNPLPAEVIAQIRTKADGVPLFVEEITKSVIEAQRGQVTGNGGQEEKVVGAQPAAPSFQVGIPTTLHDALMARLDRLGVAKEIAQLGATIGREFSSDLLHALAPMRGAEVQSALAKLGEAEILYQRGLGEHAHYVFKHALIQDTAYQSLLKSKRQQLHQQITRVLEDRFPDTKKQQPELLAHHYTEAGLIEQAIPYWQQAGQQAVARSATVEAVAHFTKGLALLKTLPETPERISQELTLQLALGPPLSATKGIATPEVRKVYVRARELCQQMGETPQLFPVLFGLWAFYQVRGEFLTARELGEQLLTLAQNVQDSARLLMAHWALGETLLRTGEFVACREHVEQGIALYNPQQHRSLAVQSVGIDSGIGCRDMAAMSLWFLGYPDQALKRIQEALTLGHELSHPYGLGHALAFAAFLHLLRREGQLAQEKAEALIALAREHEFAWWLAAGITLRGGALAEQGQAEEGMAQLRQGLAASQATGAELDRPGFLAVLAETQGRMGQVAEGLKLLEEATAVMSKNENRSWEAELYRLKGQLTLQSPVESHESKVEEAEACFLQAIAVARKQQAKSLELRAVTSLSRLWQQQGKKDEARQMLAEIYGWFTEGLDTKDLQEAKALLEGVSRTLD